MTTQRYQTPVVQTTVEEGILEAEAELARVEELYGRPSGELLGAIERGEAASPWQVCEWVGAYRNLEELRAIAGPDAGSPTSATESSTRAASRA